MNYEIIIKKRAVKFIKNLSKNEQERILTAIYQLPFKGDIKPIKGRAVYIV